jgi:hypothetical protein
VLLVLARWLLGLDLQAQQMVARDGTPEPKAPLRQRAQWPHQSNAHASNSRWKRGIFHTMVEFATGRSLTNDPFVSFTGIVNIIIIFYFASEAAIHWINQALGDQSASEAADVSKRKE